MTKILFVCLGNICRSPLAEGIMLKLVDDKNLPLIIDSAGTANDHIGEMPDKRTIANAKKHAVDLAPLRARQFATSDFNNFDKIYVMDKSNLQNILAMAVNDEQKQKVELFLNASFPQQNKEVPDSYYSGEQGFEDVFQLVYKTCEIIAEKYLLF